MMKDNPVEPFSAEESRLAALLQSLDSAAAPPDAEFLSRLRSSSLLVFGSQADRSAEARPVAAACHNGPSVTILHSSQSAARPRWFNMKSLALLATAVVTLVGAWFSTGPTGQPANVVLADALEPLNTAESLHLRITQDGKSADVYIRQPGLVRWEESNGSYRVARGSRLWEVNPANPSAEVHAAENPWFGADGRIDLLALLAVAPHDRSSLLGAEPSGLGEYGGRECVVYRRSVMTDAGRLRLEAFVGLDDGRLLGITARPADGPQIGPPRAELTLLSMNLQVDDQKFRVPVALAEQDYIGKVTDLQGIVVLRPALARRWTPLCRDLLVQPGDWIRTDVRGANAATIELVSKQKLVLGPGSLLEVLSATEARLHGGQVQVTRTDKSDGKLTLRGLGDDVLTISAAGKGVYEIDRADKLVELRDKPRWLQGYDGSAAEDSIGSLIVNIDGRDEPLTVGEHHVTVEIRDQIARTTIEETFVNHTPGRMEGTFHFPLPQDASISGFGMWIGDELVEADIVEKQRAREIYETILREKRDPGLLEWTGGNIFKARVFPIEPHSEKRVKIVYTQVLPLRGNRFRYSYGLRSEMLATHPLRELNIKVLVSSAVPLAAVESPTHTCRINQAEHSANLEFTAQEYTPTKDFEVVCEVDHRENDVVVIPHRRGDDGYFLMQLSPPGGDGDWTREVIADGEPLEILLLCDTSGSMDSTMRESQAQFVAALLSALGEEDRFNLAACDVEANWAFDDFLPVADGAITQARDFLSNRVSLGWTDLDAAFDAVLAKATPATHVIYVGDGIVATTQSDPAAFVARLRAKWQAMAISDVIDRKGQGGADSSRLDGHTLPTVHSVSVGSAYESIVLKGLASLGSGSTRQISGESTPQETAFELLNEIAQPGLRDLQVEFRGVKVAAVYPQSLPNVPAGTQQILVGRYLPEGQDQQGEVIVTGTRGGEPVRFVARLALADAEAGNSFIPRLWARAHLDQLLQQGSSPQIQEEIIGLSEEFHIITPYTSLLVLESDADRERFGVQRRFEMRDGEKFFAEGRDDANYELRQQQMRLAGNWRLGLRRQLLAELIALGRDASAFDMLAPYIEAEGLGVQVWDVSAYAQPQSALTLGRFGGGRDYYLSSGSVAGMPWGGGMGGVGGGSYFGSDRSLREADKGSGAYYGNGPLDALGDLNGLPMLEQLSDEKASHFDVDDLLSFDAPVSLLPLAAGEPANAAGAFGPAAANRPAELGKRVSLEARSRSIGGYYDGSEYEYSGRRKQMADGLAVNGRRERFQRGGVLAGKPMPTSPVQVGQSWFESQASTGTGADTLRALFPPLPAAAEKPSPQIDPILVAGIEGRWTAEALELSKSLGRAAQMRAMTTGLRIVRTSQSWNSSWDRLIANGARLELWTPGRWLTRDHGQGVQPIVHWCDAENRGVYSEAIALGQQRAATDADRQTIPLGFYDYSLSPPHLIYGDDTATVERPEPDRAVLSITSTTDNGWSAKFLIDTSRGVVLKFTQYQSEKESFVTEFSEFVEVAGRWWATKMVITTAGDNHPNAVQTQTISEIAADDLDAAFLVELAHRAKTQVLVNPLPSLTSAKLAAAEGRGTWEDHFLLLLHHATTSTWDKVYDELRTLEAKSNSPAGMAWLRATVQLVAGRRAEALEDLTKLAEATVAMPAPADNAGDAGATADLHLAGYILGQAYPITSWDEYGRLVALLQPVYERQPDADRSILEWESQRLSVHSALNQNEAALAVSKGIADKLPGDPYKQIDYMQRLINLGQIEQALEFLRTQMARTDHWEASEIQSLRESYVSTLESRGRWEDVLDFIRPVVEQNPDHETPYARYLTALTMTGDIAGCDTLVVQWLKEADAEGELPAESAARVTAALNFALGQGYNLYRYYGTDPKWRPVLLATARSVLPRADRATWADRLMNDGNFHSTDEADRLRGYLIAWTLEALDTLTLERMQRYVGWLQQGRLLVGDGDELQIRQVTTAEWDRIAAALLVRWETEADADVKYAWGELLYGIHSSRFADRQLPFVRRLIADGGEKYRDSYRSRLFELLLAQPWTAEIEAEAFAVWPSITSAEGVLPRLQSQVPALYRLVDAMIANRIAAAELAVQDAGNTDELTRTDLAKQTAGFTRAAREGVADSLVAQLEALGGDAESPLLPWLRMEKTYLDVVLQRNKAEVLRECWEILGDAPPGFDPAGEPTAQEINAEVLQAILRLRAWGTIRYFVARKDAGESLVNRVLAYIDAGITQADAETVRLRNAARNADEAAVADDTLDIAYGWKQEKFDLLVLLDRPDDIVVQLEQWIAGGGWTIPWRLALARLRAERGEISDAIALLEGVRKDDELAPVELQLLSDLQMVQNDRAAYERSRIEIYKAMEEWQLSNLLQQQASILSSGQGPHEIDDATVFVARALFEKTSSPGSYYWQLQQLYTSTHDFRLLETVAETVLGRTRQQAYDALNGLRGSVLAEIRKEATADELLAHLEVLRARLNAGEVPRGADPNARALALDLRALDLLEALVERRCSEVLNQPGPHVARAVAAMQRAFGREWQPGERLQMASFLYNLGSIAQQELAAEQLREIAQLYEDSDPGSEEQLRIGQSHAQLLYWNYGRRREGFDRLESAIRNFSGTVNNLVPYAVNDVLRTYSDMLQDSGRFQEAEQRIVAQLAASGSEGERQTYVEHLNALYDKAYRSDGLTSLGQGHALFDPLVARLVEQCRTGDDSRRYNLLIQINGIHDYACDRKLPQSVEKLLNWANALIPELLRPQQNNLDSIVQNLSYIVAHRAGWLEGLEFLVARVEEYPRQLEFGWQDSWSRHSGNLGEYRTNAAVAETIPERVARLRAVEERLLVLTLAEMRRDLTSQRERSRYLYSNDYSYFWSEQQAEFLRTANEVLRDFAESPRTLTHVAYYLWHGLDAYDRAIEVLFTAQRRGLLDDGGLQQLIGYLHERQRYAESIALLEPWVDREPDRMDLRVLLLRAYHHSARPQQFDDLAAATDAHFHKDGRWSEGNIAALAGVMVEAGRSELAAGYFEEAINLRQRTAPNRGIGDGTLSNYYSYLSSAYSQLGQTDKAVDAAAGAIVSWGNDQNSRQSAVQSLKNVLAAAKDLAEYVKRLDTQAEKEGTDTPIIRKALGQVYQDRQEWQLAIAQYNLALELQPGDREVHQGLIACYTALGDNAGVVKQLLAQIDFDRHNLEAYKSLVEWSRMDELLSERAATSLVESAPGEAESHQALAEVRQTQDRWQEAIAHWTRVAELRKLEPTGLLGLAKAQLHEQDWAAARETIRTLRSTEWPAHFGNIDDQARELENQVQQQP